tara:strand:+ start:16142 stop:17524 length:1383 start_codon:yes stop_codon:yes gene_type:complete
MAPKLDLNRMKVTFPDSKIDENFGLRSKRAQAIKGVRNTLIGRISDYVSEQMNIGLGMPKSAKAGARKIFESVGVSGGAIADAIVDADAFEGTAGFRLSEISAMKTGSNQQIQLPSAYETKVKGVGGAAEPAITAVSRSLSKPEGQLIKAAVGGKQLFGQEAISALFSKELTPFRNLLFLNARIKFANLLVVDTADIEHQSKPIFKFITNPLQNISSNVFKDQKIFARYFQISIKIKSSSSAADKYRIEIKPTAELFADMEKGVRDLTKRVNDAHLKANGIKFSQGLLNYLINQEIPQAVSGKDAVNEYLSLIVAFAKEFERGGLTPFTIRSVIESPRFSKQSFNMTAVRKANKKDSVQKFISGAQLSALVQKRLGAIMPKGPRRGPPLSPNILTERTGRFRSSVAVLPNYRANVIRFFYDPIYKSLIQSQRNPDILVTNTVREVVQGMFARKFNIVRGN